MAIRGLSGKSRDVSGAMSLADPCRPLVLDYRLIGAEHFLIGDA